MSWKPDVCIHHFPCDDGFAAAWVVHKRWPDCQIVGTNYGQPFPVKDVVGKNLLIADFSYKPAVLEDLLHIGARSIIVLDHHKTAKADLEQYDTINFAADDMEGLPPIVARFDMQRSGAALTWQFAFPGVQMPALIELVEDRDLWRFKYADTRAFSLYLRSFDYSFDTWEGIHDQLEHDRNGHGVRMQARAIERYYDRRIAEMLPTATLKSIGKWKDVPVAHAPYAFASDLAHELLKAHPGAPFAAVVVDSYGARTYSLRSTDDRQDVSEVARQFGGGGHRNAAGFRVPA